MKIPSSFKLADRTWEVVEMDDESSEAGNMHGDCCESRARIRVHNDESRPEEFANNVFFHELAHVLLYVTTKPKLSKNEDFVESLGKALHQYMQTQKGSFRS